MHLDRAGMRVLSREECLALLTMAEIGRVAVTTRALPLILPVRYAMDDDRIVVSTGTGTTLDLATRDAVVAFEADGRTGPSSLAWSVHVNGVARHVTDAVELDRLSTLELPTWSIAVGPPRIVSISTDHLSGRLQPDGSVTGRRWDLRPWSSIPPRVTLDP